MARFHQRCYLLFQLLDRFFFFLGFSEDVLVGETMEGQSRRKQGYLRFFLSFDCFLKHGVAQDGEYSFYLKVIDRGQKVAVPSVKIIRRHVDFKLQQKD